MADNTLLKYFFSSGSEVDPEGQFNLTRLGGRAKGLRDAGPLRKQKLHGLPPCLAGFSRCPYGYNAQLLGGPPPCAYRANLPGSHVRITRPHRRGARPSPPQAKTAASHKGASYGEPEI